jgi:hypothetical protein
MTELDRLGWAAEGSLELGGSPIGVRTTSAAFWEWLNASLPDYRSSKQATPVYSIVIGDGSGGGGVAKERYHILYKGTIAIARTTDLRSLVRTFLSDLETYLFDDRTDAMFADMNVVSLGSVKALIPGTIVPFIGTLGRRRLQRTGLSLPAETSVALEPGTGRVVPLTPWVQVSEGWIDGLASVASADGTDPRAGVEEPTTIDVLASIGWGDEPVAPISRGLALYRLASHVANLEILGGKAVANLVPIVQGARCYELASAKPEAMLDALLRVLQPA